MNISKFAKLIKKEYFNKNCYSLKDQINQNSKIIPLISQYSIDLWIIQALVVIIMLIASFELVIYFYTNYLIVLK